MAYYDETELVRIASLYGDLRSRIVQFENQALPEEDRRALATCLLTDVKDLKKAVSGRVLEMLCDLPFNDFEAIVKRAKEYIQ